MKKSLKSILVALVVTFTLTGCTTQVVPPGNVVMVLKASGEGKIYKSGSFTAYGRDRVYFVDTKLKSFTEKLKILCDDNVNMGVDIKWIGSFDISANKINIIKEKVPSRKVDEGDITGYQLSLSEFYKIAIKDIVRANARAIVAPYKTDAIPKNRIAIEKSIKQLIISKLTESGYPVKTSDVLVSNLDYDPEVTATRKAIKQAQLEDQKKAALAVAALAQAKRNEDIARENGKALVETAKAEAKANKILTKSLTPAVLKLRQWEAMERIGKGTNNELVIVPYEALGGSTTSSAINRRTLRGTANP